MNLYRVRYGLTYGGSSSSEWKYYENLMELRSDLLIANLEIAMEKERGYPRRILSAWRDFFKKSEDVFPRTTQIYTVEKVKGDEWVQVEYKFFPPEVEISD